MVSSPLFFPSMLSFSKKGMEKEKRERGGKKAALYLEKKCLLSVTMKYSRS